MEELVGVLAPEDVAAPFVDVRCDYLAAEACSGVYGSLQHDVWLYDDDRSPFA